MSEEEIIKNLKDFIEAAQEEKNFIYYSQYKYENEIADYIKDLLDLYNKEKEKNKSISIQYEKVVDELEKQQKEIEILKKKRYILNAETEEVIEIPISDNYISKDKIRKILDYYGHTPADNPDTTIAFYQDIKKLLEE